MWRWFEPWTRWTLLVAILIGTWVFSLYPQQVETRYSQQLYPAISASLRFVTNPIPFSLGDLLYLTLPGFILWRIIQRTFQVSKRQISPVNLLHRAARYLFLFGCIYLVFQLFWGMNYSRNGLVGQWSLDTTSIKDAEVNALCMRLAAQTDRFRPANLKRTGNILAVLTDQAYGEAGKKHPALVASGLKVKTSLFGTLGNYLGYTGYFNPFTGEAQVNSGIPDFLLPNVHCHELAHQLGYAREDEASMIGYLAAMHSSDSAMRYAASFSMFLHAYRECKSRDSSAARQIWENLSPRVLRDISAYRSWINTHETPWSAWFDEVFEQYLQWNGQKAGQRSYDLSILLLIGYERKYGKP